MSRSDVAREDGDEGLRGGEGEHELGADDEHLWRQALEEGRHALVLDQLANDRHAARLALEVLVLDARLETSGAEVSGWTGTAGGMNGANLDHVERLRDGDGRNLSRKGWA